MLCQLFLIKVILWMYAEVRITRTAVREFRIRARGASLLSQPCWGLVIMIKILLPARILYSRTAVPVYTYLDFWICCQDFTSQWSKFKLFFRSITIKVLSKHIATFIQKKIVNSKRISLSFLMKSTSENLRVFAKFTFWNML